VIPTRMLTAVHAVFVLGLGSLAGCESDIVATSGQAADEPDAPPVTPGDEGWFAVAPDLRRCAEPRCGGFVVRWVNREETPCPDGTIDEVCYVSALDTHAIGLTDEEDQRVQAAAQDGRLLVRGVAAPVGVLLVHEAWIAQTKSEPAGTFSRVVDNGIMCVAAPCPSMTATDLNRGETEDIAGLDFDPSQATYEQVSAAMIAVHAPDGIVIAGGSFTVEGEAGQAPGRTVTEFYLPVGAQPAL
jgi:hypothetical protein